MTGEEDRTKYERLHTVNQGGMGMRKRQGPISSHSILMRAFQFATASENARCENAPVSKHAAFVGLYHRTQPPASQRFTGNALQVGDTSVVFWADRPTDFETLTPDIFGEPTKDDPDRNVQAVRESLHGY